jgi:hypothetical protein
VLDILSVVKAATLNAIVVIVITLIVVMTIFIMLWLSF